MGRPRLLICAAAVLLAACTASTTSSTTTPPATSALGPTSSPQIVGGPPVGGTVIQKTVATGLDHPATFVFDKTGAIYYGERLTGEVRRIDPTTGKNTSVFTIPDVIGSLTNERGLVGLSLPPTFPQQPWLYALPRGRWAASPRTRSRGSR